MDRAFNSIDGDGEPIERIKLLHYSDMGTQFSHRLAIPRLAAQGRQHWFDGEILEHPRADLAALFEREYAEALAAGRRPGDYANPEPYGDLVKKSERHHRGNVVTRGKAERRGWRQWLGAPGKP